MKAQRREGGLIVELVVGALGERFLNLNSSIKQPIIKDFLI